MQISSTSDAGQGNDFAHIEYFGHGGVIALKTNKFPRKTTIDCTTQAIERGFGLNSHVFSAEETQWHLSDLDSLAVEPDFFVHQDIRDIHSYGIVLGWCMSVLSMSPAAKAMLKEASEKGWMIALEDLGGSAYCIDVEQKLILLEHNALVPTALGRSSYFRNAMLVTLSKALRDVWQEKRHGGFDEQYRAEHLLLLERIRAADCDVISVMIGWELRVAGYTEYWRHLIGSENGDMAMCLSAQTERDPAIRPSGRALATCFRQWFRSHERVTLCDHATLNYMDDILAQGQIQNPFGKKKPAKMNIEILSCLPDKTAYLQGLGSEILTDPLYSGVDDTINQTHFFHILYDLEAVTVQNVPFRSTELARKIFPDGMMSAES